jgi:hypothetical protein
MHGERLKSLFGAAAIAALALGLGSGAVFAQQGLADAPKAKPTTFGEGIIEPLREIGHVQARTPFCKALFSHSSLAISSAIDFEKALLTTVDHFRAANLGDELNRHKSVKQLTKDLNRLADLSLAGRAELDELKTFETDTDRQQAAVDFANALNGAKGRQMDIARKLSRTLGIIAEQPIYTNVTLPSDLSDANAAASAFRGRGTASPTTMATGNILDLQVDARALELRNDLFDAVPGDEMVGRDLRRAGENGRLAMTLGGCK